MQRVIWIIVQIPNFGITGDEISQKPCEEPKEFDAIGGISLTWPGGKGKDWNPLIHFNDRPIHSLHFLSLPITSLIFFLVNFTIMKNQQPIIFWALVYSCSVLSNCAKWGQFTEWPFMHSNGRNLKWPFKIGLATKQALSFSNLWPHSTASTTLTTLNLNYFNHNLKFLSLIAT